MNWENLLYLEKVTTNDSREWYFSMRLGNSIREDFKGVKVNLYLIWKLKWFVHENMFSHMLLNSENFIE